MVRPDVAFSTLQPVTMAPSAVSSAAPTLKPENVATAWRRAPRAAFTSGSETGKDALQQRDEVLRGFRGHCHHLVVVERCRQHAGRRVRDAGDAEHDHP